MEFPPLYLLPAAVIICVHFVWCLLPAEGNEAVIRRAFMEEVNDLAAKGFKEITLLGQNVDSYLWYGGGLKKDFKNASEIQKATATNFAALIENGC